MLIPAVKILNYWHGIEFPVPVHAEEDEFRVVGFVTEEELVALIASQAVCARGTGTRIRRLVLNRPAGTAINLRLKVRGGIVADASRTVFQLALPESGRRVFSFHPHRCSGWVPPGRERLTYSCL